MIALDFAAAFRSFSSAAFRALSRGGSSVASARATAAEIARIHQLDDDALARVGQDRETLVNGAVDRYLAG